MGRYDNLLVERRGDVLWLRINRTSRRNALSRATLAELGRACAAEAAEPALKAAVVIGEGSEAFAAGGDLKELSEVRSAEEAAALFDMASAALDELRRFPVLTVAALNGLAVGGGAELAMACDFRVAAPHARVGFIQARLNISCGFGGGVDLMRRLGPSRALQHGLTAEALEARQARTLGLVDEVAAEGELLEQCVARFLEPLLAQQPQVIRAYKAMAIAERSGFPLEERRAVERAGFVRTWTDPDHWAAVEALLQKRSAR